MKVSTSKSFTLVYSLFEHEYLGYLFESYVIQLDAKNRLTFLHQNISAKNAKEFREVLDDNDYELIRLMDSMQQDSIIQKFYSRKIKTSDFFLKIYDSKKGNKAIQEEIGNYLESKRAQILSLMKESLCLCAAGSSLNGVLHSLIRTAQSVSDLDRVS